MKAGIPTEEEKKQNKKKPSGGAGETLQSVIAGDMLTKVNFEKHAFFILFIIMLVIVYIGNGYQAYALDNENKRIDKEIKKLRAEFVSMQAELNEKMKLLYLQEQIKLKGLQLEELKKPPYTISANGY